MSLNIKDPLTEQAVRELAAITGEGVTGAVLQATRERLTRLRLQQRPGTLKAQLLALGAHCAALPDLDLRTADEILGYDENGLPG